jgi:hypothetical protein
MKFSLVLSVRGPIRRRNISAPRKEKMTPFWSFLAATVAYCAAQITTPESVDAYRLDGCIMTSNGKTRTKAILGVFAG